MPKRPTEQKVLHTYIQFERNMKLCPTIDLCDYNEVHGQVF